MSLTTAPGASRALRRGLPPPRGPLSTAVVEALRAEPPPPGMLPVGAAQQADPFGDDLALALHLCYELHYRGFDGVSPEWEWEPDLLRIRAAMEQRFLQGLRSEVEGGGDVASVVDALLVEPLPGSGVSHYLRDHGEWWQLREYVAQRSIYHLKEADPQAWVIPRLQGQVKASLVAVEFDEYGGGRGDRLHSELYARLMESVGLSADYLFYLDDVPAPMLSVVNLMSLLGLHQGMRGAMVGQFASVEITSSPSAQRMVQALERLGADASVTHFFTEHVEADAVHEQLMRRDVIDGLLVQEPDLAADVVFGIQASELLESSLAAHLLSAWQQGRTSLLHPLPDVPVPT